MIFYQCGEYGHSDHQKCVSHYINESTIVSALKTALDRQVEVALDIEKSIRSASGSSTNAEREKFRSLRMKRRNLEAKKERLLIDLTNGILNREEYEYTKNHYSEEIEKLRGEESEAGARSLAQKETFNTAQKWLNSVKQYHRLPVLNREIVDIIVDKIFVLSDRQIEIKLNYSDPYKAFASILKGKVTKNAV